MSDLELNVIHIATGESKKLRLPDNVPVQNMLPKIVKAMGGDGNAPGGSRLLNKTQAFDYNPQDTLAGRNTTPSDTLGLVQDFKAGGVSNG